MCLNIFIQIIFSKYFLKNLLLPKYFCFTQQIFPGGQLRRQDTRDNEIPQAARLVQQQPPPRPAAPPPAAEQLPVAAQLVQDPPQLQETVRSVADNKVRAAVTVQTKLESHARKTEFPHEYWILIVLPLYSLAKCSPHPRESAESE